MTTRRSDVYVALATRDLLAEGPRWDASGERRIWVGTTRHGRPRIGPEPGGRSFEGQ
jgi:hypothetical protein